MADAIAYVMAVRTGSGRRGATRTAWSASVRAASVFGWRLVGDWGRGGQGAEGRQHESRPQGVAMDTLEAVAQRRSIRRVKDTPWSENEAAGTLRPGA